jgi:membrane protease YdiL (CAAX protease family)
MTNLSSLAPPPAPNALPASSWPRVVAWHLAPGVALTAFAALTGPLLHAAGLPPIWGLLTGVLAVQVPLLFLLTRRLRAGNEDRRRSADADPRPRRSLVPVTGLALGTLLLAVLLPGAVVWLEPVLLQSAFGWLPDWWSSSIALGELSSGERVVTIALWVVGNVILGPISEELYFRGPLLDRISAPPLAAAVVNAGLFAVYHLWQPYAIATIFLSFLPLAIARSRFRVGIATCCVVHCAVNALMLAGMLGGAFAR